MAAGGLSAWIVALAKSEIGRGHSGLRYRPSAGLGDHRSRVCGVSSPHAEQIRLASSTEADAGIWKRWGAYLSERSWGTVREDYSPNGTAWEYFPHDHARSRAYRWSEDGMAGISDIGQRLCLALALWNGKDPILKERMFGLTGNQGNHGEDAKEYWWYLDATPTHSWLRWRYHYPQADFPYADLVDTNAARGKDQPEYELIDTGVFDENRFWQVTVDYAKADAEDICMRIEVRNLGPEEATIHVLPTLWFRNTWSWGSGTPKPTITPTEGGVSARRPNQPAMSLQVQPGGEWLFCDNETNAKRIFGSDTPSALYPKDAINDAVVHGMASTNPDQVGTKAAVHYILRVPAGGVAEVRVRLHAGERSPDHLVERSDGLAGDHLADQPADLGAGFEAVMSARKAEADQFYADLTPLGASEDEAMILRQASAGMVWGQQFFHVDVARWLEGDPGQPPPPAGRKTGRNAGWFHLNAADVISMPDAWEYPWFAAWDLAFHTVALAHIDPAFAKHQLVLLCREWFMHPNGQLPAYEWAYGDVNPPVHAWAALQVFAIDGGTDVDFLARIFHKLLINFTWWVNRTDLDGNNVFEGGFLGLDNIGPFDRSQPLPIPGHLEQSDGTAWMAMYCLNLLEIALTLAKHDRTYEDVATKFFEHFAYISTAMNKSGMWDDQDGFFYDAWKLPDGLVQPMPIRSIVGLIPLYAVMAIDSSILRDLPDFKKRAEWFIVNRPEYCQAVSHVKGMSATEGDPLLLSLVPPDKLARILGPMLDPEEFLSPHGLRALSRRHLAHPYVFAMGGTTAIVDYEPGESTNGLFGGNSNWRGPIWMPVNVMIVHALDRFGAGLGDSFRVQHPTGSQSEAMSLGAVADDLGRRLISLFERAQSGDRPVFGAERRFHDGHAWRDQIPFHEYFHGDTGAGLGASHQTGWTGLVIELIRRQRR